MASEGLFRYIMFNEDGTILDKANTKDILHNHIVGSIQWDQDRGFEIYYVIIDTYTKKETEYVGSRSGYKVIKR